MSGFDYVLIGSRPAAPAPKPLRTALGVIGVLASASAGWLASHHLFPGGSAHGAKPHFFSTGETSSSGPFVPQKGVEALLVRPMPPGPVQLLSPGVQSTSKLFVYGAADKGAGEEAWVYGAKLGANGLAQPTGQEGDILKGHLQAWQEGHTTPAGGRRGVVSVVVRDGSATPAYWFYQHEGMVPKKVFIDGEAGTTGLQVLERLSKRCDIELIQLGNDKRKDVAARKEALNSADVAILCLPDEAAKEAVALMDASNTHTVVIDASTAYRVNESWTYGFPELYPGYEKQVQVSKRISNPGCYPTGFISLIRPLVDAGFIAPGTGLTVNAVSGYSGGGKALIKIFEESDAEPWGAYGFNLAHKHLPEMGKWSGLQREPIFMPSVGSFAQGMVVSVPIHYDQLTPAGRSAAALHGALSARYKNSKFVTVRPLSDMTHLERGAFLRPDTLANSNDLELTVYANDAKKTAWLVARLDNLGKGASGAAVQNMNLALGLDERVGLC